MTESQPAGRLHGIDGSLLSADTRDLVQSALDRIREQSPDDFRRLQQLVREIRPLPDDQTARGLRSARQAASGQGGLAERSQLGKLLEQPCIVLIDVSEAELYFIGCLAHEFGHVCTTRWDLERQPLPAGRKNYEVAACGYMLKWGFEDEIDGFWQVADDTHLGCEPGSEIVVDDRRFLVTEDYQIEPKSA